MQRYAAKGAVSSINLGIKRVVNVSKINYRLLFLGVILFSLVVRIYTLWLNVWPINGDEAQYWSWGKHLAWGYYSKPPMVAWAIAVTTHFFGDGPVGLRLASPITYAITSLFLYLSGTRLFNERTGFWCAVMFLFIPGVTFSSSIISTDPFLLMFWSVAFYGLVRALEKNELSWWLFTGIALGLSFYGKYAAILFTLSLFLYLLLSSQNRRLLKTSGPYLVLVMPFIMLIPNLLWNYHNHFASVIAVKNNADLSGSLIHVGNLINFVASQFAMFGPILFACLLLFLFVIRKYIKQDKYLLLTVFAFLTLGIMTIESFLSRAHANWSAPAYIAASILVVAVILERKKVAWLWAALVLHFMVVLGFVNIQPIVRYFHVPMDQTMTITSWPEAGKRIDKLRQKYPDAKVLADTRMLLTQVMYFGKIPLKDMFTWNRYHQVQSQYDLVTHMNQQIGKNFLLFSYTPKPTWIHQFFTSSKNVAIISLMTIDGKTLPLYVYYITEFKGY